MKANSGKVATIRRCDPTSKHKKVTLGGEIVDAALDRYQVWRITSGGVTRDTPIFRPRHVDS